MTNILESNPEAIVPESNLAAIIGMLEPVIVKVDITDAMAETIIDLFRRAEIWPIDTDDGIGFFAGLGDQLANEILNTTSEVGTLNYLIHTHYIYDDDSGWERAEKLGLELRALSDELLASAERGKAKWPSV